jgi:hypothetical protein
MSDARGGRQEPLFAIASADPLELELEPRRTSWVAAGASSQIALGAYLDHVEQFAAPTLSRLSGDLCLRLDVGLPTDVDPLHEHDLDNFLRPVIQRLGAGRFGSAGEGIHAVTGDAVRTASSPGLATAARYSLSPS